MRAIIFRSTLLSLSLFLIPFQLLAGDARLTREQVIEQTMKPFTPPKDTVVPTPCVNRSTMTGKVLCGYQGWHAAEGDGAGRGWYHWTGRRGFKPGSCNIDLWPDGSELDADERYATPFKLADAPAAEGDSTQT